MPSREQRKITTIGSSGAVVIPKPMLDYFNLKAGDKVTVLYNSLLVVVPEKVKHLLETKRDAIASVLE